MAGGLKHLKNTKILDCETIKIAFLLNDLFETLVCYINDLLVYFEIKLTRTYCT